MGERRRYVRTSTSFVTAVCVTLDTDGFTYRKWGGEQTCKPGDWLVDNNGDVYTVDGDVFARTYTRQSPGVYVKPTFVWAVIAEADGVIRTKEGTSRYSVGDYLVYNDEEGTDGYCMSPQEFERLYTPAPASDEGFLRGPCRP